MVGAGLDKFFERARESKAKEAAAAQAVKDSAMMSANLKADLSMSNTPTVNNNPTEVGSVPTSSQINDVGQRALLVPHLALTPRSIHV